MFLAVTPTDDLREAFNRIEPGGTILLDDGVYTTPIEQHFWRKNRTRQPLHGVTVMARNVGGAILRPPSGVSGLDISFASGVIVVGVTVDAANTTGNGVLVDATGGVTLRDVTVLNAARNGIRADADVDRLTLERVTIQQCGTRVPENERSKQHGVYAQSDRIYMDGVSVNGSSGGGVLVRAKVGPGQHEAVCDLKHIRVRNAARGITCYDTLSVTLEEAYVESVLWGIEINDNAGTFTGTQIVVVDAREIGIRIGTKAGAVSLTDVSVSASKVGLNQGKRETPGAKTRLVDARFPGCQTGVFFRRASDIDIV